MTPTKQTAYKPFVPETMKMREFTVRALIIGLLMTIVLGAANAYLGLRAGITIAATYPAAVIGMAVLRLLGNASILEENIARTAGSIGESVAAGAIFTIPAFVISKSWVSFRPEDAYWKSTVLMMMGGVLGVLFVSLVRRVMVEDPELPFPESVAAAEIHKAGQLGAQAAKYLFYNIGIGAVVYFLGVLKVFVPERDFNFGIGQLGRSVVRLGAGAGANTIPAGGFSTISAPSISPAYIGVGYIIGPRLAALNFAGGLFAWAFLIPLLVFLMGPQLQRFMPGTPTPDDWAGQTAAVWRYIVRPIAVGGMMVGAAYTLFRMRKNLSVGLGRAFSELRKPSTETMTLGRLDQYMSSRVVLSGIFLVFVAMIVLYSYLADRLLAGVIAAVVMLIAGFFFATVSGSLVGMIGSSNNPISGLTLSTLILAALLMVSLGVAGASGVTAVLGVAAVVCVSSAVAGELLQDFKVGYILGGTPRTIQLVELIAVVVASAVMYFPLLALHTGNINLGGIGFGDKNLPAPQAGLMAALAQGIVGGDMPWPLVLTGAFLGVVMIMVQVRSPMLVAVGMYLPLGTTFAIFVGGLIRWWTDVLAEKRGFNEAQLARVENTGVLTASGLIAGEGLMGLTTATFAALKIDLPSLASGASDILSLAALLFLTAVLVWTPLSNPGRPEDPAPPTAIM